MRTLLGELKPAAGGIEKGERTIFNYVDQSRLILNDEETVFETIVKEARQSSLAS
ncbi:MAG: hypothetical protein IPG53_04975 [Ignavibacteriales bacterium]|nr:hypothetical protein [Ignavibacteriales bacterium]